MTKKQMKIIDDMVSKTYYNIASNVIIPLMSIPTIFNAGRNAILSGLDPAVAMQEAINKVKKS